MTSIQQRAALHRQIWAIANEVRGAIDGWDFKQYVLGALFYRFISENFTSYIEARVMTASTTQICRTASLVERSKRMPSRPRATLFVLVIFS